MYGGQGNLIWWSTHLYMVDKAIMYGGNICMVGKATKYGGQGNYIWWTRQLYMVGKATKA